MKALLYIVSVMSSGLAGASIATVVEYGTPALAGGLFGFVSFEVIAIYCAITAQESA